MLLYDISIGLLARYGEPLENRKDIKGGDRGYYYAESRFY